PILMKPITVRIVAAAGAFAAAAAVGALWPEPERAAPVPVPPPTPVAAPAFAPTPSLTHRMATAAPAMTAPPKVGAAARTEVIRVRADRAVALVNGVAITAADLAPLGDGIAAQAMSAEELRYRLDRAL